jgi:hypothetical protein
MTYEYLFCLPSSEWPRPPAQWKARGLLSGSGTMGHQLCPSKSGYGPVPSSDKWLGNQVPHTVHGPIAPGWRGGTTNLKELNPGMIHTSPFYPSQIALAQHSPRPLVATLGGCHYQASDPRDGILGQWGHLKPDKTRYYVRNTQLRCTHTKNVDAQITHLHPHVSHYRVIWDTWQGVSQIRILWRRA